MDEMEHLKKCCCSGVLHSAENAADFIARRGLNVEHMVIAFGSDVTSIID
jgi:hypothetical protein